MQGSRWPTMAAGLGLALVVLVAETAEMPTATMPNATAGRTEASAAAGTMVARWL